jgi:hypothetical protein
VQRHDQRDARLFRMSGISKEQAKKNIRKTTGLTGRKLDNAAAKFVRRQKGRKKRK